MVEYNSYSKVKRMNDKYAKGFDEGVVHIFPKLDGTNSCTFMGSDGLSAGSRRREISLEADNAGFAEYVSRDSRYLKFHSDYPHLTLYGEWLVPHTLKTYREDAWRNFYVFDVRNDEGRYLTYEEYSVILKPYGINVIPPLAIINNPSYGDILKCVQDNTYLIADGQGIGEGVVCKNYGTQQLVKLLSNAFKDKAQDKRGSQVRKSDEPIEWEMVDKVLDDEHIVRKTYAKIINENLGWESKFIPELLGRVYHDVLTEELPAIIKKHKNPTINFKTLNQRIIYKTKEILKEELGI